MAKSNKQAPNTTAAPVRPAVTAPPTNYLERPDNTTEADGWLQKIFYGVAALALIVMIALSFGSGINADDKFQNDYSTKLVNYYGSFGKDTTALYIKDGNMHLYGGFFEIVTGFVNKAANLTPANAGYHHVRHVGSAVMGWLAILFSALLARHIAGWRAGIFTFVLMFLSPRFLGDSMMNPKDIPFACGYIMALYFMVRMLDSLPTPKWGHVIGAAGGLAIALATRAGGLLPFAMFFMFGGLHFMFKNGGFSALGRLGQSGSYFKYLLIATVAGYAVAVLFWPYALQSPFKNPLAALTKFSQLEIRIRVLFEGMNVRSDLTPWYYAPKWIYLTIPLAGVAGFVGSLLLSYRLVRRYNPVWVLLVFFAGIFPVFYVVYKDSVLHDGWRHLTFAYPGIAIAAGLFWNELCTFLPSKKAVAYAVMGIFGLLVADSAAFIGANPAYPYIYFNPIEGGVKGAFGHYETDYWGVSVKQGLQWMEEQKIISDTMTNTVIIATSMFYPAHKYVAKYGDKVKIKYLKYESRCNDAWDYAIYPTRTVGGPTLRKGMWPNDNAVHVLEAGGAPILAIMKDNGRNCSLGITVAKVNDFNGSIARLKEEVKNVPDNEVAWGGLANAYLSLAQAVQTQNPAQADSLFELSKQAAERTVEISPDDSQGNNLIGMYYIERNDLGKAKTQFEYSAKMEPSNPAAFYYLALIATEQNNMSEALAKIQKAIESNPSFKPAYELGARLHERNGNTSEAARWRAYLQQLK